MGLADQVYSNYRTTPGGIYYIDRSTGLRLMWPNHVQSMFSRGRSWTHTTDARGFRNPIGAGSEIVLMGDSMIYGQAVELEETVSAQLSQLGSPTYNLSRQGDSLFEHYTLARLYFPELKPKKAIVFIFGNDFHDIVVRGRASAAPPAELSWDYEAFRQRIQRGEHFLHGNQFHRLRTVRLFQGIRLAYRTGNLEGLLKRRPPSKVNPPLAPEALPATLQTIGVPEKFARVQAYYERMLPELARLCESNGTELRVVYLHVPLFGSWPQVQDIAEEYIRELCARKSLPFATTRELFEGTDCLLEGDGHLSADGHRMLAQWLKAQLTREESAEQERSSPE